MDRREYEELIRRNPSIAPFIQRMSGSWRNREYYRAIPAHIINPTPAVLKARIAFGKSAYRSFGEKGLKEVDETPMPPACRKVRDDMKGRRFAKLTTREKRLQSTISKAERLNRRADFKTALEKLKESLISIGRIVEESSK